MSISFGSAGKKPYVGSKEVKEAYVGSTMVYQGVPPIVYAFQGSSSTYTIAPWCELNQNAQITTESSEYRIALKYNSTSGYGTITLNKVYNNKLKFIAKRSALASVTAYVQFYNGENLISQTGFYGYESSYQSLSFDIPAGCNKIIIRGDSSSYNTTVNWIDEIRYEKN